MAEKSCNVPIGLILVVTLLDILLSVCIKRNAIGIFYGMLCKTVFLHTWSIPCRNELADRILGYSRAWVRASSAVVRLVAASIGK